MADIGQFFHHYNSYNSTFKETSFDNDNSVYLCTDESQNVINFDKLIEDTYPNSYKRPKSFDAIYKFKNDIYLVEFKNQKPSKITNNDVEQKLLDGKKELDIFLSNLNIQKNDYNFKYCVVYKNCNKTIDKYKCGVSKNIIEFGLEKCKNTFIKDIVTNNIDFFTKILNKKLIHSSLDC